MVQVYWALLSERSVESAVLPPQLHHLPGTHVPETVETWMSGERAPDLLVSHLVAHPLLPGRWLLVSAHSQPALAPVRGLAAVPRRLFGRASVPVAQHLLEPAHLIGLVALLLLALGHLLVLIADLPVVAQPNLPPGPPTQPYAPAHRALTARAAGRWPGLLLLARN